MTASPKASIDSGDLSGAIRDAYSATNAITARAGGGQALATALTTRFNRVTTVATAADSVLLPPALAGANIVVYNNAANALAVFPQTGANINALAANASYSLATVKSCMFFCVVAGTWNTLLSA